MCVNMISCLFIFLWLLLRYMIFSATSIKTSDSRGVMTTKDGKVKIEKFDDRSLSFGRCELNIPMQ